MDKDNPLVYKEKPYYTDEEIKTYYKLLIAEAEKVGDEKAVFYYTSLLYMLDNMGEDHKKFVGTNLRKK